MSQPEPIIEQEPRLLNDLNPLPGGTRPTLEPYWRPIFWALIVAPTVILIASAVVWFLTQSANQAADAAATQKAFADNKNKQLAAQIKEVGKTHERAIKIAHWVEKTVPIEPLVLSCLSDIDGRKVTAKSLEVSCNATESQINIKLTLIGEETDCRRAIDAMETRLRQAGMHKGTGEDANQRPDGLDYLMLWQYRPPTPSPSAVTAAASTP